MQTGNAIVAASSPSEACNTSSRRISAYVRNVLWLAGGQRHTGTQGQDAPHASAIAFSYRRQGYPCPVQEAHTRTPPHQPFPLRRRSWRASSVRGTPHTYTPYGGPRAGSANPGHSMHYMGPHPRLTVTSDSQLITVQTDAGAHVFYGCSAAAFPPPSAPQRNSPIDICIGLPRQSDDRTISRRRASV